MSDMIISIVFFVLIFCFLTYSCQWFGRTLRRYNQTRRAFDEQQSRQSSQNTTNSGITVYTIENGRHTLINYSTAMPPRSPAHLVMKEDLPPTYNDAIQMQQVAKLEVPSTAPQNQRRSSSVL